MMTNQQLLESLELTGDVHLMDYATGESIRRLTASETLAYAHMVKDDTSGTGAVDGAEFGFPGRTVYAQ